MKLLSVTDEDKENALLAQLRNKGLKLIGEWDNLEDDESEKIDTDAEKNVDETFDTD